MLVTTGGAEYTGDLISYVPSGGKFSGGQPVSLANVPNIRSNYLEYAKGMEQYKYDIGNAIKSLKMQKRVGKKNPYQMTPEILKEVFPDDFEFTIVDADITEGIANLFMAHRLKLLEALERQTPGVDLDGEVIGPSPWDVVNEALKVAGFPYEVISPTHTPIMEAYEFKLEDKLNDAVINAIDLSSGEKVLLQLVLWLFSARKDGVFPKLLLLDEPDAHLHPAMTTQFLDVISEVLVKQHGVRVIMTSHSPSTVAMAPEGSVFQLERGSTEITLVTNRDDIISVLTAGVITVSRTTKYCFVEDEGDVAFYTALNAILSDKGPSRDRMALEPSPTLVFIPASIGTGSSKISGGSTVVAKWVNKLDDGHLKGIFFGIIDDDDGAPATDRVFAIGRYSFENYLLDPINVFALLLENGSAPAVPGVEVSSGDEHLLRLLGSNGLQSITNTICDALELKEPSLAGQSRIGVNFSSGAQVEMPTWVLRKRGHDLLPVVQSAFGGAQTINPPRLIKAMKRCRVVPVELAALLRRIQSI